MVFPIKSRPSSPNITKSMGKLVHVHPHSPSGTFPDALGIHRQGCLPDSSHNHTKVLWGLQMWLKRFLWRGLHLGPQWRPQMIGKLPPLWAPDKGPLSLWPVLLVNNRAAPDSLTRQTHFPPACKCVSSQALKKFLSSQSKGDGPLNILGSLWGKIASSP